MSCSKVSGCKVDIIVLSSGLGFGWGSHALIQGEIENNKTQIDELRRTGGWCQEMSSKGYQDKQHACEPTWIIPWKEPKRNHYVQNGG